MSALLQRERGQAMTLEAVASALLLLVAVGFALQMTAVTPLSASTSSQHLENQLQKSSEGVFGSIFDVGDKDLTYDTNTKKEEDSVRRRRRS